MFVCKNPCWGLDVFLQVSRDSGEAAGPPLPLHTLWAASLQGAGGLLLSPTPPSHGQRPWETQLPGQSQTTWPGPSLTRQCEEVKGPKAKGVEGCSALPQLFLPSCVWGGSTGALGERTGPSAPRSCPGARSSSRSADAFSQTSPHPPADTDPVSSFGLCRAKFLNLCANDILDRILLCPGGHPVHCRMLSSISGLCALASINPCSKL